MVNKHLSNPKYLKSLNFFGWVGKKRMSHASLDVTPPKFNMEAENWPWNYHFQLAC